MEFFSAMTLLAVIIMVLRTFRRTQPKNVGPIIKTSLPNLINPNETIEKVRILKTDTAIKLADWINNYRLYLISKPSVIKLLEEKDIQSIGYRDLLECYEWQFLRLKILKRDMFQCQKCLAQKGSHLHVHHKYYLKNHLPWEFTQDALITLCSVCHHQEHEDSDIKLFMKFGEQLLETTNLDIYCKRCGGTGYLAHFKHVQEGICFQCLGDSIVKTIFQDRLREISKNRNSYNINRIVNESYAFLNQIDGIYYEEVLKDIAPKKPLLNEAKEFDDDDLPF